VTQFIKCETMKKSIKKPRQEAKLPAVVQPEVSPRHAARVALYDKHYNDVGEALLGAVLRAFATSDASYAVNSHLTSRFGLDDSGIDIDEVRSIYIAILKLEVAEILTRHSRLSPRSKRVMIDRIIARAHPRRDGVPSSISAPKPTRNERVQDIESVITRELKRAFPPHGMKTAPLQGLTK